MAVDSEGAALEHVRAERLAAQAMQPSLFRSELRKLRTECERFRVTGYVNRLQDCGRPASAGARRACWTRMPFVP